MCKQRNTAWVGTHCLNFTRVCARSRKELRQGRRDNIINIISSGRSSKSQTNQIGALGMQGEAGSGDPATCYGLIYSFSCQCISKQSPTQVFCSRPQVRLPGGGEGWWWWKRDRAGTLRAGVGPLVHRTWHRFPGPRDCSLHFCVKCVPRASPGHGDSYGSGRGASM